MHRRGREAVRSSVRYSPVVHTYRDSLSVQNTMVSPDTPQEATVFLSDSSQLDAQVGCVVHVTRTLIGRLAPLPVQHVPYCTHRRGAESRGQAWPRRWAPSQAQCQSIAEVCGARIPVTADLRVDRLAYGTPCFTPADRPPLRGSLAPTIVPSSRNSIACTMPVLRSALISCPAAFSVSASSLGGSRSK